MATPPQPSPPRPSRKTQQENRTERSPAVRTFTRGIRQGKVRKEFWLDPQLLRTVKEELGVATEREAVEMALDLIVFRKELAQGVRRLAGIRLTSLDE